ncbi:MAG: non-canonical purine NTP pyrophosphatase, partial [Nocardia sp.]|nr:non-canonical purine NTP pyrophosphatase [Nocardia sp.]
MSRRVLLASRNAKKLSELRRILAEAGVAGLEIVGLDDVPEYP